MIIICRSVSFLFLCQCSHLGSEAEVHVISDIIRLAAWLTCMLEGPLGAFAENRYHWIFSLYLLGLQELSAFYLLSVSIVPFSYTGPKEPTHTHGCEC